jgi:HEAT repeat protein
MSALDNLLADLTGGDEARAEACVPEIIALGEEALVAIRDLLDSPDADTRWWAVRVIANAPPSRAEVLLPLLEDVSAEVRQAAALGLANHPDEKAISSLVRALRDEDSLVSSLASAALVKIGKAAVPSLMEFPTDARMTARINALRALAEISDHRAIPTLMAALDEDSAMLTHWAEEGLERLGLNMVYLKPE